jgi:subtilase family serine protease
MKRFLPLLLLLLIVSPGQAQSGKATLHGSAPAWANSKNYAGVVDPSAEIGFRVYLSWNNSAAAEALAQAVSDPHSSSYRHYLTPGQFRQQFAPSHAQIAAVQSWLESQGFAVNYTPKNNHYVSAQGTVGQAQAAFGTQFAMYKVKGKTVRSPSSDVSIPSSLGSVVASVVGLDESAAFVEPNHVVDTNAPPAAGFRNAPPLSEYWAQLFSPYAFPTGFTDLPFSTVPWTVKGYTPAQIKAAYGISGYDGAGQTVAIIDAYASPTILQDVNQWSTNRGLPTMNASQLVQVVPPGIYNRPENPKQDPQGWYG